MIDLKKYSRQELKEIIKILKKYKSLKKNTGKKAYEILRQDIFGETRIKVEYFPSLNKDEIKNSILEFYKKLFKKNVNIEDIMWIENSSLCGGLRLYFGDYLVDITYADLKNKLK